MQLEYILMTTYSQNTFIFICGVKFCNNDVKYASFICSSEYIQGVYANVKKIMNRTDDVFYIKNQKRKCKNFSSFIKNFNTSNQSSLVIVQG